MESNFLAKVFSKSCTGLNPNEINWLVIRAGLRLCELFMIVLYSVLVPLDGKIPDVVNMDLKGFDSPRSIKPTISLASVVVPFLLVTHTSILSICTCDVTTGKVLIALL